MAEEVSSVSTFVAIVSGLGVLVVGDHERVLVSGLPFGLRDFGRIVGGILLNLGHAVLLQVRWVLLLS